MSGPAETLADGFLDLCVGERLYSRSPQCALKVHHIKDGGLNNNFSALANHIVDLVSGLKVQVFRRILWILHTLSDSRKIGYNLNVITDAIKKVADGLDLTREEASEAMNEIMGGSATDAQIASLITALRMKGETVEEISGFAEVMREKAVRIEPKNAVALVDTCGTGGDLSGTFNISTTTAFVVAGAGVPVAKHGNRSVSSACGSADLLEALGVNLAIGPDSVAEAIDKVGIGFLFAPALHQAMKYAIGPRKEIGIRTVFNILGPLTNPAGAEHQLLGVYSPALTETMAQVLLALGTKHALVVHGEGLDEMTTAGATIISEAKNGSVETYEITPEEVGLQRVDKAALAGGTVEQNAQLTKAVLDGKTGPARDIVLLNAAAALTAADKTPDIHSGLALAAESINSGKAAKKLQQLIEFGATHE